MTIKLRRALGLTALTFYGVGSLVGAGIYTIVGIAAGEAGSFLWLSFICAGIAAFLTVLSYSELASALTKTGAEYQYIRLAFPAWHLLAFLGGYIVILNAAATAAVVSIAFADYLNIFFSAPVILTAFILLLICTIINISGIRESTWFTIVLTCIEISGLVLVIILGFYKGDVARSFVSWPNMGNISGILIGSSLIFFTYIGFEDLVNLSEETLRPSITIPRALIASTLITTIIYILVAVAVIGLIDPFQAAASDAPLTTIANTINPLFGIGVSIAALFATASTALIALISISRMIFAMARDSYLPKIFAKIHPKRQTPYIAAILLFIIACLFLSLQKIKTIAGISSFGVLLIYIVIHVSVIVLRFSRPDLIRPFKVPYSLFGVPILPVIGILFTFLLILQFDIMVYKIAFTAIFIGVLFYFLQWCFKRKN